LHAHAAPISKLYESAFVIGRTQLMTATLQGSDGIETQFDEVKAARRKACGLHLQAQRNFLESK